MADSAAALLLAAVRDTDTLSGNPWHDPKTGQFANAPPGLRMLHGGHLFGAIKDKMAIESMRRGTPANGIAAYRTKPGLAEIHLFNGTHLVNKTWVELDEDKLARISRTRARSLSGAPKPPDVDMVVKNDFGEDVHVTSDVEEAARLLGEGKKVELHSVDQVSMLLDRLALLVKDAERKGEAAPDYNLCHITVKNTNLFCVESKGVPRVKMPQLKGVPLPGSKAEALGVDDKGEVDLYEHFKAYLEDNGIIVHRDTALASHLKATQNELNGKKVAGMKGWLDSGGALGDPDAPLFVSHDNYVVDGHHRWAATVAHDISQHGSDAPGEFDITMNVDRIEADIIDILELSNSFAKEWGIPQADASNAADKAKAEAAAAAKGTASYHPGVMIKDFGEGVESLTYRFDVSARSDGGRFVLPIDAYHEELTDTEVWVNAEDYYMAHGGEGYPWFHVSARGAKTGERYDDTFEQFHDLDASSLRQALDRFAAEERRRSAPPPPPPETPPEIKDAVIDRPQARTYKGQQIREIQQRDSDGAVLIELPDGTRKWVSPRSLKGGDASAEPQQTGAHPDLEKKPIARKKEGASSQYDQVFEVFKGRTKIGEVYSQWKHTHVNAPGGQRYYKVWYAKPIDPKTGEFKTITRSESAYDKAAGVRKLDEIGRQYLESLSQQPEAPQPEAPQQPVRQKGKALKANIGETPDHEALAMAWNEIRSARGTPEMKMKRMLNEYLRATGNVGRVRSVRHEDTEATTGPRVAGYADWGNNIVLRTRDVWPAFERWVQTKPQGPEKEMPTEYTSYPEHFRLVLHEARHLGVKARRNLMPEYATREGSFIEEALNETLARHDAKRLGVFVSDIGGAYSDEVGWLRQAFINPYRDQFIRNKGAANYDRPTTTGDHFEAENAAINAIRRAHATETNTVRRLKLLNRELKAIGHSGFTRQQIESIGDRGFTQEHTNRGSRAKSMSRRTHTNILNALGMTDTEAAAPKKIMPEAHTQLSDEWMAKLSPSEQGALSVYQDDSKTINIGLRSADGDLMRPQDDEWSWERDATGPGQEMSDLEYISMITAIDRAIEKAPPLRQDTLVYRGMRDAYLGDLAPGDTFTDHGFGSTSARRDVAYEWAGVEGYQGTTMGEDTGFNGIEQYLGKVKQSNVLQITVPKGTQVGYPDTMMGVDVTEVLLQRGSTMRVDRVEDAGGVHTIHVTVVGREVPPAPSDSDIEDVIAADIGDNPWDVDPESLITALEGLGKDPSYIADRLLALFTQTGADGQPDETQYMFEQAGLSQAEAADYVERLKRALMEEDGA